MDKTDISEWSQHFDFMQWLEITIFTTGVFLLLGTAYTNIKIVSPWFVFIGLWFTNIALHFTAGFRVFRNKLHLKLLTLEGHDDLKNF